LLANLRWLSTARASYPRKITRKLAFHRFQGLRIEIIEENFSEKVIHRKFILSQIWPETRHFGGTPVVQINM
jgi:hypothetical protein